MGISANDLDELLGVSFSSSNYNAVSVENYTTQGDPPFDFINTMTVATTGGPGAGVSTDEPAILTVSAVDDQASTITLVTSVGGMGVDTITEHVLAFAPDGILVSLLGSEDIADLLDSDDAAAPYLTLITPDPVPAGTSLTASFQGAYTAAVPCFAAGTLIDTPAGGVSVEDLRAGDTVCLADGGEATIVWLGHRRARDTITVRFRPGALGPDSPRRDLVTSDDHALLVAGALVPAGLLVNGATILAERRDAIALHHIELDRHAILLAEGAPAESYLDTGNRRQFGNCPIGYDPIEAAGDPCADLLLAGSRLAELRRRLDHQEFQAPVPL